MNERKKTTELDRRSFLKGAFATGAAVAAGSALAACAPSTVADEPTPKPDPSSSGQGNVLSIDNYASTKWDFEIAPDPIPEADITATYEADVIVIGAGLSGLTTAAKAQEDGLNVILISSSSHPIGRGGSNQACNSKLQKQIGVEYGDLDFIVRKEMQSSAYRVDQRKWWNFFNKSGEAMDWLMDTLAATDPTLRVVLERGASDFDGTGLCYCAPGSHSWMNDEVTMAGMGVPLEVAGLDTYFQSKGGQVFYSHWAEQLIRENNNTGRVSAVIAKKTDTGEYVRFNGGKAIVMATGDFSADHSMMAKFCPEALPLLIDVPKDDYDRDFAYGGLYYGQGHKMGLWVGAAWQKTKNCAPMFAGGVGESPAGFGISGNSIILNTNGERICNENLPSAYCAALMAQQPDGTLVSIWDADYAYATDRWFGWGDYWDEVACPGRTPEEQLDQWTNGPWNMHADTLEELIDLCELPKETTLATIKRYNELMEAGDDADFHKNKKLLYPIKKGPFFASKSALDPTGMAFLTVLGGLRTDINMQVCDAKDVAIPGLFNVGTMMGDFWGAAYSFMIEGGNLGQCVCFGYRLGKMLAAGEVGGDAPGYVGPKATNWGSGIGE